MCKSPIRRNFLCLLPWLLMAHESRGVIVAGTQGTGNNNNTQAGLDGFLITNSQPAFPYWQNLVRVNDASGVYLGFNPITQRGWVLSAQHVGSPATIGVAGSTYTVQSGYQIGTTDLRLHEIGGGISDPGLPSLPTVPLATALASVGDFSLMFGRGFTNSTSAPFPWVAPGTNDANGMRWGTNRSEGYATYLGNPYIVTEFDHTSDPSVTAFEAQGASGDSGGGLFIYRGGQWQLSGIAFAVGSPDANANPSEIGDSTYYSDVFAKATNITALTGTLIPEPSTMCLTVVGMGLALLRRRR